MTSFHAECLVCGERVVSDTRAGRAVLVDRHRFAVHGIGWGRHVSFRLWETMIRPEGLIRRWLRRRRR